MRVFNPVVPTLIVHPAVIVEKKPESPDEQKLWVPPSAQHVSARYVQFLVLDDANDPSLTNKMILVQPGCFFETDIAGKHTWFLWKRDVLAVVELEDNEEVKLTNGKGSFLDGEDEDKKNIELMKNFDKELLSKVKPSETYVDAPTIIIKSPGGITA